MIPFFWLPRNFWLEYSLFASLSYLIHLITEESAHRIKRLTEENDRLRQTTHRLSSQLQKGSEWERELRYLSQLEERNK